MVEARGVGVITEVLSLQASGVLVDARGQVSHTVIKSGFLHMRPEHRARITFNMAPGIEGGREI